MKFINLKFSLVNGNIIIRFANFGIIIVKTITFDVFLRKSISGKIIQ